MQTISDNLDLKDDSSLRSLDIRCIRSLNGKCVYTFKKRMLLKLIQNARYTVRLSAQDAVSLLYT